MKTLIKNGNIVYFDKIERADLLIDGEVISAIGQNIKETAD